MDSLTLVYGLSFWGYRYRRRGLEIRANLYFSQNCCFKKLRTNLTNLLCLLIILNPVTQDILH